MKAAAAETPKGRRLTSNTLFKMFTACSGPSRLSQDAVGTLGTNSGYRKTSLLQLAQNFFRRKKRVRSLPRCCVDGAAVGNAETQLAITSPEQLQGRRPL